MPRSRSPSPQPTLAEQPLESAIKVSPSQTDLPASRSSSPQRPLTQFLQQLEQLKPQPELQKDQNQVPQQAPPPGPTIILRISSAEKLPLASSQGPPPEGAKIESGEEQLPGPEAPAPGPLDRKDTIGDRRSNWWTRLALTVVVWILVVATFPIFFCCYFNIVYEYEKAVIFKMGNVKKGKNSQKPIKASGVFFTLPCIEEFRKVDMRTQCLTFTPLDVTTSDFVFLKIDGLVYYRVTDAVACVMEVVNPHVSMALLTQSLLRSIAAKKSLTQLMAGRDGVTEEIRKTMSEACAPWGIAVERVAINNIVLPAELQKAVSAEAEEVRYAKARIAAARGEKDCSRAFREAAEVLSSVPGALQLQYLQTLKTISKENASTIVLPFPVELLRGYPKLMDPMVDPGHPGTMVLEQSGREVTSGVRSRKGKAEGTTKITERVLVSSSQDLRIDIPAGSAGGHNTNPMDLLRMAANFKNQKALPEEKEQKHGFCGIFGQKQKNSDGGASNV